MTKKQLPQNATPALGAELARHEGSSLTPYHSLALVAPPDLAHADKIVIDGLEVFAHHGVYPAENELGQKFIVSLVLYVDLREAGQCDELSATVSYGTLAHETDAYLRAHTFKLIEAAAEHLAAKLLECHPQLLAVRVRIDKPWAAVGLPLQSCGVEIERIRQDA